MSVERLNSEAIPRDKLMLALRNRRLVMEHRKLDKCLLCCSPDVNESALCIVCWSLLSDEEYKLGERWLCGVGP
jgi:hypothetical protein